jgi:hypothetical protein
MDPTYSGYSVYAELKVGANGTNEGVAEISAGDASGSMGFANTRWDGDLADGVDSDWVQVRLVADPTGVTWTVGDSSPVHLTTSSPLSDVLSLKVRAGVNGADRQSSWRDLVVSFYGSQDADLSRPSEQLSLSRAMTPVASTVGEAPDATADRAVDVVPDGTDYHKVMLTASVRIESLAGVMPSPEAMFGQVYLYSSPPVQTVDVSPTYVAISEPVTVMQTSEAPTIVSITNFTETSTQEELLLA